MIEIPQTGRYYTTNIYQAYHLNFLYRHTDSNNSFTAKYMEMFAMFKATGQYIALRYHASGLSDFSSQECVATKTTDLGKRNHFLILAI